MREILAKFRDKNREKITLSRHTSDVLEVFENIRKKLNEDNSSGLVEATKAAIFLHDLGKVLPSFQIKTLGNKEYQPQDVVYDVPHSLFSIFWIDKDELKNKFGDDYFNFIISAVAYHHWRESFDEFILGSNKVLVRLCEKVLGEWGETLKSNLHDEFSELNEYGDFIDINKKWLESIINGRSFVDLAIPPYKLDYEPLRGEVKKERILIAGFLQRCDHFASWCEKEGESLDRVEIEPKAEDEIENKIAGKIGHDAWQFGTLANNKDKNVILVAPTGYGKTEFAFLWSRGEKLLYTLPIRSAVNQTYEGRAKEVFGEGKAGLLHSDADVYLLSQETDEAGTMKLYDLAKQLSYPVMISTGDQFFPYALRPPGYEKVFALLSYSRLVIDEIQAYDPKACAIVTKFMEWMHKMGGKFLLMTATLPKFVENRIKESAPDCEMINIYENEKDKFQKIFKHKLEVELIKNKKGEKTPIFELPEDKIEKIIREAESGKRVLVILNTVNFAQEVYRKLVEKACSSSLKNNIFLLHSRFTLEDRRNKETEYIEKFKNPKPPTENIGEILVATQVVEASLDIDADVLFTEICPLDALIQRMGRVLRRYFYRDGKVMNKSDNLEYDISQEEFRAFSNEPNVYVWVFVKGLQSGRGKVYSEELIKLSLAWLWKKKEIEDIEPLLSKIGQRDGTDEVQVEDFFKEEFSPLLGSDKKTEKSKETYYKKLLNGNWLENVDKMEVELSEYDKYALVTLFYSSLKGDGEYLKSFFDTLDLLDAGWMASKKSEAQKTFREIVDISVIPEGLFEPFCRDVIRFIQSYSEKKEAIYTLFKREVLSKYLVSVSWGSVRETIGERNKAFYRLFNALSTEEQKLLNERPIESWIRDIFIVPGGYDCRTGFNRKSKEEREKIESDGNIC